MQQMGGIRARWWRRDEGVLDNRYLTIWIQSMNQGERICDSSGYSLLFQTFYRSLFQEVM
jgi:hypothetical protein